MTKPNLAVTLNTNTAFKQQLSNFPTAIATFPRKLHDFLNQCQLHMMHKYFIHMDKMQTQ